MSFDGFVQATRQYAEKEWENIVEGADNDLTPLDEEIIRWAATLDRKHHAVQRALIEHHPEIARLRNRIENLAGYPEDRRLLAWALRPDVVRLMAMRTHRAQLLGHDDYLDFVLKTAGISLTKLEEILEKTLVEYLPRAKELVDKHGLEWQNWFRRLRESFPLEKERNAETLVEPIQEFFNGSDWNRSLTIHMSKKGLAGFARKFPDRSVHVKTHPLTNAVSLKTLIHELSHAGLYLENDPAHPENFLTPPTDEFLATYIEDTVIEKICTQTEKDAIDDVRTLELVRIILSAQFELDLWQRRDIPETCYRMRYERLMPVHDELDWTLDTFRSVDSLLIMFYALGHCARDVLQERKGPEEWGVPDNPAGVRISDYFQPAE